MSTLTLDQIRDAQLNGFAGLEAVNSAMTGRIAKLAEAAARRIDPSAGAWYRENREDFRQDGALAMFEALPRFDGDTVDAFYAFMWSTIENTLKDKVREERNGGADADAVKIFGAMVEKADGDVYLAEKFAQTLPPKGRRLGADRAQAARLAWQGAASLDAPPAKEHYTGVAQMGDYAALPCLGEQLASSLGIPEDLLTADDMTAEENRVKHAMVWAILDSMSANQANALRHSYGIGGAQCFGTGIDGDLLGLAAFLGVEMTQARDARTKGHKAFAKRYIKAAARSEEEAKELTEAAAINLGHGGRK
jgi:hypothetical protein